MTGRDGNLLHILVIAASSERRRSLAAISGSAAQARITTSPVASLDRAYIQQIAPDAVVVDADDLETARTVIRLAESLPHGTGMIVLVDSPDPRWVTTALQAGLNAILSRDVTSEEVRLAIVAAEAGLILLHPSSIQDLGTQNLNPSRPSPALVEALTAREREVLRLVSEGLGNKEIASRLDISDHTVKFHISSILGKLGATSRTEAVSQGIRRGIIAI